MCTLEELFPLARRPKTSGLVAKDIWVFETQRSRGEVRTHASTRTRRAHGLSLTSVFHRVFFFFRSRCARERKKLLWSRDPLLFLLPQESPPEETSEKKSKKKQKKMALPVLAELVTARKACLEFCRDVATEPAVARHLLLAKPEDHELRVQLETELAHTISEHDIASLLEFACAIDSDSLRDARARGARDSSRHPSTSNQHKPFPSMLSSQSTRGLRESQSYTPPGRARATRKTTLVFGACLFRCMAFARNNLNKVMADPLFSKLLQKRSDLVFELLTALDGQPNGA